MISLRRTRGAAGTGRFDSTIETEPFAPAAVLRTIYRQGDRWMMAFIAAHLCFAFAIAPAYQSWRPAIFVGGGFALVFGISAWRWPGSFWTRCVAGVALQGFAALHIYQMHGLAEMHFFVFTAATMMIAYEDVIALWPGVVGIVAQHTVFAYWHNEGHPIGGVPFMEHHHASLSALGFHFGIAVVQVVIASFWAHALRRRTLAGAAQRAALATANIALAEREAATADSLALVEATLEAAADGILVLDESGRVTDHNDRLLEMWSIPASILEGGDSAVVLDHLRCQVREPDAPAARYALAGNSAGQERFYQVELTDGRVFECHRRTQRVGAQAVGSVLSFHDVTERVRLERELATQALTDALTGLANRVLFRDRVAHALARSSRDAGRVAILIVDLDGFKLVNDGLGHSAGDAVLREVANCFRNAVREGDTVARLGGDEFAILLEDVRAADEADAAARRVADALAAPIRIALPRPRLGTAAPIVAEDVRDTGTTSDREIFVKASVGIAISAPDDEPEALLRNADVAMYAAKSRGKGQAVHFEHSMHERAVTRLRLEEDLRSAVFELIRPGGKSAFRVLFQPIVALDTEQVVSAEALLRWHHPERGIVSPAEFIPVAEDTGLIVPLGRWVLAEACRAAAAWPRGEQEVGVSVNLSGRQLQDATVLDDIQHVLTETGLAPSRLTLEITESVVMCDTPATLQRLTDLKALGLRLAIDDFGTGYSSLSYLRQFPVDILKIDKSFIDGIARGGDGAALARTIVALADTLQLRTVAEGIEEGAQRTTLQSLGCTLGQGFLFARPIRNDELMQAIAHAPRQRRLAVASTA